ncbi:MAG: archease [Acidimicrobiia bacterium]|nr:archease [Acidimicrobiia bacterium]
MGGSFTVLSHTADTGIEVAADTLDEVFEWAAIGMFSTMYDLASLAPTAEVEVAAANTGFAELLVDVLSDLIHLSEVTDVVPCAFHIIEVTSTRARLRVGTAPLQPETLHGPPIKAVTYHQLSVEPLPDGTWTAQVVFDV